MRERQTDTETDRRAEKDQETNKLEMEEQDNPLNLHNYKNIFLKRKENMNTKFIYE